MEETVYWLALQQKYWLIPAHKIEEGIKELGSMEKFWKADEEYLVKLGLSNGAIKKFNEYRSNIDLGFFEKQVDEIFQKKIRLVPCTDKEYPSILLKSVGSRAPRLLFHKGMLLNFNECVAIGGRRNCSESGRRVAYNISRKLAENGYTTVSGLAIGIDTEAHKGALDVRGKTIAVLAWMEPVYPSENLELSKKIEERGAILSECYRKPVTNLKWRFVERNKIISGLSKFVIVIETSDKGGSISLATYALSQRKKVFVLKPEENNKQALRGYKLLLSKGATSKRSYDDLLSTVDKDEALSKSFYQSSLRSFEKTNDR